MKYGLSAEELLFLNTHLLAPLKIKGANVYIFGSRARGTHQKYSDVDILIESDFDLSRLISAIAETLEASNFPYKVDIVESRELASGYRQSVERDKIAL